MSRDLASLFNLVVQPTLEQNAALPAVSKNLSFDDIGDFVEERQRIQRKLESLSEAEPKTDFSDFANHVFFDSAMSKFDIAKNKILNQYPFNGSSEDKDLFTISGSYYENYVTDNWPHYVGYGFLSGGQVISASDDQGKLYLAPSQSLYVTARIAPAIPGVTNKILSVLSGGQASHQYGYTLNTTNTLATFTVYSGSSQASYTALFTTSSITNRFATLGVIYDAGQQKVSMWLDASRKSVTPFSPSVAMPTFGPAQVVIGTNYTGSIAEIRVLHTASELFHVKNYSRPITSEDYVKLNYRFNEGTTGISTLDANVIDYSKSKLHAQWMQYGPNCRRSGSTNLTDPGDLILYPMQPDVMAYTGSQETAAEIYDAVNRNYIMRLLPDDLLIDDQNEQGLLTTFALAMARYFDDLKMHFDQFDNLRITNYADVNESPDLMLPLMKKYFGWKVTDHFSDSDPLQFLFGEGVLPTGSLDTPLLEIKNQFWRRILNNLPYLYKTKGKRDNLDSFFNVLGINPQLINLKEYGSVYKSTINDEYLAKEKAMRFLSMSAGDTLSTQTVPYSTSGSSQFTAEFVYVPPNNAGLSQSFDLLNVSGQGNLAVAWDSLPGNTGRIRMTQNSGALLSSVFDFSRDLPLHISVYGTLDGYSGLQVRQLDESNIVQLYTGSISSGGFGYAANGLATLGANSGSNGTTIGEFSQLRFWNRALSSADLDAHAFYFENLADSLALASGSALVLHYPLNENLATNVSGALSIQDWSAYHLTGTFVAQTPGVNQYDSRLIDYRYLSPTFDLKWTQNKIRIRNKSKLDVNDLANDNNQVALEFNLTDALNEDISKIFSTMDAMNNIIGAPINKYRDHYHDLESYRELYFQRLTDSLHFTKFFKLFRWFDKKLAVSIKQLLPARTDFIGGEFVVESHMLERNKYQYLYPIFHTPKDIDGGNVAVGRMASAVQQTLTASFPLRGTTVRSIQDTKRKLTPRPSSVEIEGAMMPRFRNVNGADYARPGESPYAKYAFTSSLVVSPDFSNPSNYQQQSAWVSYAAGTVTAFTSDGNGIWGYPYQQVTANSVVTGSYVVFCSSSIGIDVFLQDGSGNSISDTIHVNLVGGVSQAVTVFAPVVPGQSQFVSLQTSMPHDQTMTARNMTLVPLLKITSPRYSVSGDDSAATELPNLSLNYAKEGARRAYDNSLARARGQIIDPQITNGLWSANGFVFSNIDSNDSEGHYFGAKKSMEMRIIGTVSGSSSFTCGPGAQTQSLPQMQLTDRNGVLLNVSSAFCFPDWGTVSQKLGAVMSFEVSCSSNAGNNGFQTTDFYFQYADNNTAAWPLLFVNPTLNRGYVLPYSVNRPVTNDPGWVKYTMNLRSGLETAFALSSSLANSNQFAGWRISMANTTAKYAFRKLRLDYYQPLTDAGVNYFQKLGNSHTNKIQSYVSPALLKPSVSTGVMPSGSFFQVKNTVMGRQFSPYGFTALGKSGLFYGTDSSGSIFSVSNDYGKTVIRSSPMPALSPAFTFDLIGEKLAYALCLDGSSNLIAYKSTDACVTWKQVVTIANASYPSALVIYNGGVYFSFGNQISWVDATGSFDGQLLDFDLGKLVIDSKGTFWGVDANNPTAGVYRSFDQGVNWTQVFSGSTTTITDFAVAADGWAYIAATSRSNTKLTTVLSSSTGAPLSFGVGKAVAPTQLLGSAGGFFTTDNRGNVYYSLSTFNSDLTPWTIWRSADHGRTWAVLADFPSGSAVSLGSLQVSPDDSTFITTGFGYDVNTGFYDPNYTFNYLARYGKLENNQVSYGPSTLATSQQFVSSSVSGNLTYGYKLGNVSEFPHYGGLFQMRNIVLGTQNIGKIGSGIDNVVEVTHVGSVVNVLWPDQSTLTAPVIGFGESSIGQSPGNLTNEFTYGVPFDVSGYDHMSLYCYALKQAVGTQDDIIVKVQRRPLLSVGFATDQTVEYTVSGSFTEARYRDIHHTKAVNYASLNGSQVSYVIDVPLVNVREVRVGARHKFGQDAPNQNFLVWARFIDSKTET